jgi:TolB-like protein/Flp pilus assembly protein TadD
MSSVDAKDVYQFDRFRLDLVRGVLSRTDGAELALRPKSFAMLQYFVERPGRLVDRNEIMQVVWPGVFVTDDNIAQCIKEIRRVLGDGDQRILRTVPRRGFLLAVPVSDTNLATAEAPLAGLTVPPPPSGRTPLVVLPFDGIGGNPDEDYFAQGLTADLVTDLTKFQELYILSPPRRLDKLSRSKPMWDEALPVGHYFFKGNVRRAGGRIRVTAQLGEAQQGASLWAERFDRPNDDLFAVQEELANLIAARLDSQVGRERLRRARRRSPASLDAYDLFLQGRELHARTTEQATLAARRVFDEAIAADPSYAPAYAYQAYTVQRGFTLGWGEPQGKAALNPALELANRAVELEPDSSLCLMRLAFVLSLLSRDDEARATGVAGVQTNPCDPVARATYGEVLSRAGLHPEGVDELRLAISLDPFHPPFWRATLGRALLLAGHPEEALVELRKCIIRAADYRPCHSSMVVACVETGRLDDARAAMQEVLRLRPGWVIRDYDGVFGFRRQADTERFLAAFRIAGMPEK